MMTLEDYLRSDARLYPDKTAVICGDERVTYGELWSRVENCARQIVAEIGSPSQMGKKLMPFRSVCEIDTLVRYFAIHLAGGIAVPLEKDLPETQYQSYAQLDSDHLPEDIADVLFTTGTTGKKKGVLISNATIIADAENLVAAQGYHHDLTFIICGPLNHIGSLSKVYPMILVGGTIHLLDGIKDIEAWYRAMESPQHHYASFLVPDSLRMLMTFSADKLSQYGDRIEFIETGAAPMAQADMERLCQLLPQSRLYNTYASTETGIIATHDFNHGGCLAGCLGKPMRHSEIIIISDDDRVAYPSVYDAKEKGAGRVACKGKTLMSGYMDDEALTSSVCRDGIVYTADLGWIDEEGRLRLEGRADDVINVGGYKVVPTEVEDAALTLPMVQDCVCIPVQHRVLGTVLKLLVVLADGAVWDKRAIARGLQQHLENYQIPMQYEQVENIHRTFNGKIDRKAYLS